ncbi:hypothetical protein QC762_121895 [Podospora pseudocomata]|uniref:Uncharacterized protein n=1 Tax=Podospora pseudocomata TaxID=2093779 RepID=A0ABR0GYM8_9PEZI|nr:hypothetical protein QC762_121895 [Podospora pseudocomata]
MIIAGPPSFISPSPVRLEPQLALLGSTHFRFISNQDLVDLRVCQPTNTTVHHTLARSEPLYLPDTNHARSMSDKLCDHSLKHGCSAVVASSVSLCDACEKGAC